MKQTKTFRRLISLLLIVTVLLSVAVVGVAGVSAAEDLTINYEFAYENAGYAEGRIELSGAADDNGTYYLYWADDTKALDGYAEIVKLTLDGEMKYVNMKDFTVIPAGATKIIAIQSDAIATKTVSDAAAVYDIPESKQFKYSASDVEYNFQALSDIHIQHDNSYWRHSQTHWENALEVAADRDAEFITVCGDAINGNNYDKEWQTYLRIIADSSFTGPVYETNGNHETYSDANKGVDVPYTDGVDKYRVATGLGTVTEKLQTAPYYEVTGPNGDHFIFMALELINHDNSPDKNNVFTEAQLDWLEGLLEKYKGDGKKIFINEHAPFANYGAGDNKETPYYTAAMKSSFPRVQRLKELLEANKDVIFFSGHTHIDFKYNYNIDNENGTTAYTVHIPSTSTTTRVNSANTGLDYPQDINSSQGYFVDVFENSVVLNGTDLVKNEILPQYTYLVDYSGEALVANSDYVAMPDPSTTPTVTPTPTPDGPTITIYFENNWMWPEVSIYYWGGANGENATWPGQVMTEIVGKSGDGVYDIYKMEVPADIEGIVFSGEGGYGRDQSEDVTDIKDGYAYYMKWDEATQTKPCGSYPYAPVEKPTEETTGGTTTEDPAETVRIYFTKPANWANANIYGFEGEIGGTAKRHWPKEYPGDKMTFVETTADGDIYYADVPTDISYIKFCDGTGSTPNHRTDNISVKSFKNNLGFKITEYDGKKYWLYDTYTYEVKVDPVELDAADTVRVYFTKPAGWAAANIYGFEGEIGGTAKRHWPKEYPGDKMTFVETTADGDIYYADVPTDISYIKFCDGTGSTPNHRTDNISVKSLKDNLGFEITEYDGKKYWLFDTYTYGVVPTEPVPTEPVPTEPVPTEPVPTEPIPTEPVPTEPEVEVLYGDANQDGTLSVKDATAIQKHVVDLIVLTDAGLAVADVDANEKINVKDATMIQKFLADIIDKFPIEDVVKPTQPDTTAPTIPVDTDLAKLLATVSTTLTNEKSYASYVVYAGLKKVYYEYKDANVAVGEEAAAVAEINAALADFNTMKANNPAAPLPDYAYVIHGDMGGSWADLPLRASAGDSNIVTFTMDIAAGDYMFVIHNIETDAWLKCPGTINDACENQKYAPIGGGDENNSIFVASGGSYTFNFNIKTQSLSIIKNS